MMNNIVNHRNEEVLQLNECHTNIVDNNSSNNETVTIHLENSNNENDDTTSNATTSNGSINLMNYSNKNGIKKGSDGDGNEDDGPTTKPCCFFRSFYSRDHNTSTGDDTETAPNVAMKRHWLSFWFLTIVTILVIIAGGTISTVLLIHANSGSDGSTNSPAVTAQANGDVDNDNEYYVARYEIFYNILLSYEVVGATSSSSSSSTDTGIVVLTQSDTPQYKALHWMVYSDSTINHSDPQLLLNIENGDNEYTVKVFLQRYTMMVLFYTWNDGNGINSQKNYVDDLKWWDVTTTGNTNTCQWNTYMIQCSTTSNNQQLITGLYLDQYQLYGSIPYEIHTITSLYTFDLSDNQLTGTIPSNIFRSMTSLQNLILDNNEFTGPLPTSIGECTALENLLIGFNRFTGTIPVEYQNLLQIQKFYSPETLLYGPLLDTFGLYWSNLQYIHIDNSLYTGTIPPKMIENWSILNQMKELYFGRNLFRGTFPTEIGLLTRLTNFNSIGSNLSGAIPNITTLTNLRFLTIDGPLLTGTIPTEIGTIQSLETLSIRNTGITGTIPSQIGLCTKLQEFIITENSNLVGTIPNEIGDLSTLRLLTLQKNYGLYNGSSIPDSLCPLIQAGMINIIRSCDIECSCCVVDCDDIS